MARTLGYKVSEETVKQIHDMVDKYGHKKQSIVEMAVYVLSQMNDSQMGIVAAASRTNRPISIQITLQPAAEQASTSPVLDEEMLRRELQPKPARKRNTA